MSLNKCFFIGRFTADPEVGQTPSGVSFVKFSLAVKRDFAAKGQEKQTDFLQFTAWRNEADYIAKYAAKGTQVHVESRLEVKKYTPKDEEKPRTYYDFVVEKVQFLGSKSDGASGGASAPASAASAPSYSNSDGFNEVEIGDDEDLPF